MMRSSVRLACLLVFFLLISWTRAQSPALPIIPVAYTNNITTYGAVGNGIITNTTAIQNAINAAFAAGGGTVEIPSGTFLSGPLNFSNSINLQLENGAILRMLPYGSYPGGTSPSDFITTASGGHDLPFPANPPLFHRIRSVRIVDGMKTPQQLSREAIEEFKAAYQEEFGETLSDDEVREIATRLLRFFGILSKE